MKKYIFSVLLLLYLVPYYFIEKEGSALGLKKLISVENKKVIKKYIFPYKFISEQENVIQQLEDRFKSAEQFQDEINELKKNQLDLTKNLFQFELNFKNNNRDIQLKKIEKIELSNKKIMERYQVSNAVYAGMGAYIDFHKDNFFFLSAASGILGFSDNYSEKLNFKQIKNNLNDFVDIDQFIIHNSYSFRDLYINENKIFISFVEQIRDNCWNTSVVHGKIDYEIIKFQKLFSSKDCINHEGTPASGGRIVNYDNNNILLTVGEFHSSFLSQDKESINGKIIKINKDSSEYKIISMGHRNPQGLYLDMANNFILETEHGPQGGDEINLIEIEKINRGENLNYGWPVVSAGEHYGGRDKKNEEKYKKYPLYKSHSEHGFIEPLKSFVPSIGISEITKITGENRYVLGSMGKNRIGDKSIYFFELDNKKKIINLEQVKVFQRVRDLTYKDDKLYILFESPLLIGEISLN